ncbi:ABC transporter ATP-binding protein [Bacillaceae bacterium Marseille-Q3522]|nr:ABC transporter ATP-binding protein [Bacillaceae bacterium Marseille-Q3522]
MSLLRIDNLSMSFSNRTVLQQIDLQVKEHEFVAILGPSGSGKSTLFHLVGGILTPDEGSIMLKGKNINGKKGMISYMPQSPSLLPWRKVLENVLLGQEIAGFREKEKALQMIEKAGLIDAIHAYPAQLSGGMKQRVSFIRALLSPQPLMCLDEPFSALDELTRLDMQKWLLSMWEETRRTVLFVTHNIEEAIFLADRIIVLSRKPAHIAAQFSVPYPRPRKEELFLEESFLSFKREIYHTLQSGGGENEQHH